MITQFILLQKRIQMVFILSCSAIGWLAVHSGHFAPAEQPVDDDTSLFMRAKLVSSQKVMEGLVTEDFSAIRKGASEMLKMSEAAHWPQSSDPVYEHYSELFRNQCRKLTNQADNNDLQATHYTYLHMTTTCIDCHNYVRDKFRIKKDNRNPKGPIQLIPTEWDGPAVRKKIPARPSNFLRDRN